MPSTSSSKTPKVGLGNLVAYGLGDVCGGGAITIINLFFLYFLTEVVGLAPVFAGMVFAVGKIWDAVADPLFGYFSDRIHCRFGRRRIFFLLGIIPIFLTFTALWLPVGVDGELAHAAYYSVAYIAFSTMYTMVMVPYTALSAEMSHEHAVRNRLSGARIFFSEISTLFCALTPKIIINAYNDPVTGYTVMGLVLGLFLSLPWLFVYIGTWELPSQGTVKKSKNLRGLFASFFSVATNRSFRIHMAMFICVCTAMDFLTLLFQYYLTWVIGRPELFSKAIGALLLAQLVALPIYVAIANRNGTNTTFRLGLSIWACGLVASHALSSTSPISSVLAVSALLGAGLSAGLMVPWANLPSVIDVGELITGEKQPGAYAGAMSLIRKTVHGLFTVPLIAVVLQFSGYVEQAESQAPRTIAHLKTLFFAVPISLIVFGLAASMFFAVTPTIHGQLRQELRRLRGGGRKADVSDAARSIVQTLTGHNYDDCWPRGKSRRASQQYQTRTN